MLRGSHQHPTMLEVQVMHTQLTPFLSLYTDIKPLRAAITCVKVVLPHFPAKPYIRHSAKATELPDFKGYVVLQTSYMMYSFTDANFNMGTKMTAKCLYNIKCTYFCIYTGLPDILTEKIKCKNVV